MVIAHITAMSKSINCACLLLLNLLNIKSARDTRYSDVKHDGVAASHSNLSNSLTSLASIGMKQNCDDRTRMVG
ncbi:hypothetical protein B0H63DRAFT_459807 [Podospora didyma]|uniref:Secreted protein n=1 Tax=Podospora didyma TaxID=330526 RepID=A0AAE0U865_9PEZI|nr:hypothetical protein B0H63DRAFT_459807 [Podospora didyma]